jgi:hypothetical protein
VEDRQAAVVLESSAAAGKRAGVLLWVCKQARSARRQQWGQPGKRAEARRGQAQAFEVAAGVVPAVALPAAAAVPAGKAAHWLREAAVNRRQQRRADAGAPVTPVAVAVAVAVAAAAAAAVAFAVTVMPAPVPLSLSVPAAAVPVVPVPLILPALQQTLSWGDPVLHRRMAQDALARQPPRARAAPPPPPPRVCASASPLRTQSLRNAVHRPRRPRSTPSMLFLSSAMARVELHVAWWCAGERSRDAWQRGARRWP